ncbi:MAG TPA: hypothetical protein DCK76_00405 [Desulfotomaculum sp.]|nr:MAG: hypothetical protein XD84_1240 [Desulfotomaculum sp. 46_80]KUK85139.1 MAG: hypothetical protein XE00_0324 [Desulfofundulus kuznetsovii]HAG09881.1 hypothetical protein [Desulfotomaculum sp.]HBY04589.1 hypothetical protein [Desulfotomaculum sp.]
MNQLKGITKEIRPEIAAAVTAALIAGGLLKNEDYNYNPGKRKQTVPATWKMAGLSELMRSRLSGPRYF